MNNIIPTPIRLDSSSPVSNISTPPQSPKLPESLARSEATQADKTRDSFISNFLNQADAVISRPSSAASNVKYNKDGSIRKARGPNKKTLEAAANGKLAAEKQRKPRQPRDPNKPPVRKKTKLENEQPQLQPAIAMQPPWQGQSHSQNPPITPTTTLQYQTGAPNAIPTSNPSHLAPAPPIPQRASPSGLKFDPVRSEFVPSDTTTVIRSPAHARSSPSIASLIDPVEPPRMQPLPSSLSHVKHEVSNLSYVDQQPRPVSTPADLNPRKPPPGDAGIRPPNLQNGIAPSASSSVQPPADVLPPLPAGTGLLKITPGSKTTTPAKEYAAVENDCIIIEVPMTQGTGNYINFMKEVEDKYGFDVAYPRVAEHRRRMAQMAAMTNDLNDTGAASGDDMADKASDEGSEADSDIEMRDAGDDSTAAEGKSEAKRTRKSKLDEYDIDDEFIDDTEQAWQEQALASKDGYFVWSGPLVQENEKPAAQKEGATKRGRGRGGRVRGEISGRGRGGGPGSRGGRVRGTGATRRPRGAKTESEKKDSENTVSTPPPALTTTATTTPSKAALTPSSAAAPTPAPPPPLLPAAPSPLPALPSSVLSEFMAT